MRNGVWAAVVIAVLRVGVQAEDKKADGADKGANLAKVKKLIGTWVAEDDKGKPTDTVVSVFKLTAAGSAVQETIFPGQPHEMVSVYHMDGKDIVMTHYCAMGNQPKLKIDPASKDNELKFSFVGGTNLDPAKDMHMHEGSIKWTDDDHIVWSWQGYMDGKPVKDHGISMKLVRKK
jgi:hypothetical protein